jgi:hypothetical protein
VISDSQIFQEMAQSQADDALNALLNQIYNNKSLTASNDNLMTEVLELTRSFLANQPTYPTAESQAQVYEELFNNANLKSLNDRLNTNMAQQAEVQALKEQRIKESTKTAGYMNVAAGRATEIENQENERLNVLIREQNALSNQINTANNQISMIMGFKQTDYQNATAEYETKYNQLPTGNQYVPFTFGKIQNPKLDFTRKRALSSPLVAVAFHVKAALL